MSEKIFEQEKKKQLNKTDKSYKGSWDKQILKLVNKINNNAHYYTTSSCSGRIILIKDSEGKQPGLFLFVSHEKIELNRLLSEINKIKYKGLIWFKLDSCILHVATENLDSAINLLNKAKNAGWKRSGIMNIGKRNLVELISTETMSFPLLENGKLLVDSDFLKLNLEIANKKLERIWNKIEKLEKLI